MKYFLLITVVASLFIIKVQGQFLPYEKIHNKGSEYCNHKRINSTNLPLIEGNQANIRHSFDAIDYSLELDLYSNFISPYPKSFRGTNTVTLSADTTIDIITLNAVNSSLQIDSVMLAGVSFTHTGNILTINLDRQYAGGETLQVKIFYQHKNVSDGAFYASGGFVFTDSEPEGARKWFPCWDKPSDKATFSLKAKTPATVKLASNGRLEDSAKIADTVYYHWVSRDPVATYIMVITAKVNYNLDIVNYVHPTNPEYNFPVRFYYNNGENVGPMKNIISPVTDFFISKFGPHPFEKNGFATLNSQFYWGGMENQTLTSLCSNCWSEMLIVHEYAHQWFGDMITCATWADIFLNEGFATYLESLWLEHSQGNSAYMGDVQSNANSYLSGNPGWAISNPDWATTTPSTNELFNYSITYMKSSLILYMLRYVIGDEAFFTAMYNYANDPDLKYKSAVISDFIEHVNTAAGEDMYWYFDQWIFKPNHPVYQNQFYKTLRNGKYVLGFIAKQTQSNPVFFKMPFELKVLFVNGSDTTLTLMNDSNNQLFELEFDKEISSCQFDPYQRIIVKKATLSFINDPTSIKDLKAPAEFLLEQNYPNPFNPETVINFSLPSESFVELGIYNNLGQLVVMIENSTLPAGKHTKVFNGSKLSSGTYFCKLNADGKIIIKKMNLIK
ncbi:MAG TPA: M1 family aminopeptidase [Ignavibacteriaceae bacterium]|nr:M1 family aminopeptidase [Ignavibacteriaceae bacterium]